MRGRYWLMSTGFQFCTLTKVQEVPVVEDCTAFTYLIPWNCTFTYIRWYMYFNYMKATGKWYKYF